MATWLLDTTWAPIGHLASGFSTWSLGHPQTAGPTLGSWGTREIPKALPVTFLATSGHKPISEPLSIPKPRLMLRSVARTPSDPFAYRVGTQPPGCVWHLGATPGRYTDLQPPRAVTGVT